MHLTRDEILAAFSGQSCQLPDFRRVYRDWPYITSPNIDWLRKEADLWLQQIATQSWTITDREKVFKKLKATDVPLYVASAYPDETKETQRELVIAVIWMFMWDDTVDSVSSELGEEYELAQKFRATTLRYIRDTLRLSDEPGEVPDDVLITSFSDVAKPLLKGSKSGRQDFYFALDQTIKCIEVEQTRRLSPNLPNIDDYLAIRIHTVGIIVCHILQCALTGSSIYAMPRPEMKEMISCASVFTALANDILSLRKELKSGTIDNAVPILWQEERDVQKAVDRACDIMEKARQRFDQLGQTLLSDCPEEKLEELQKFIRTLQTGATGNLTWSLQVQRYGMAQFNKDGEYHVTF